MTTEEFIDQYFDGDWDEFMEFVDEHTYDHSDCVGDMQDEAGSQWIDEMVKSATNEGGGSS